MGRFLLNRIQEEELRRNDLLHATDDALKKGLAKGLAEGEKNGEHNAKIETAKIFLEMGLTVEQVSQGTGLSIDELLNL